MSPRAPSDPLFFDHSDLEKELRRVFDVCHTCRMCFSYCPSFPSLFAAIDRHEEKGEGEVSALTTAEMDEVVDLCYQCKLCYVKCPYTPPHKFTLDFPRLMLRAKAVRARKSGVPFRDRLLGNPDRIGRLSSGPLAKFVNWANRNRIVRRALETTAGIHRHRTLPPFAGKTFADWFRRRQPPSDTTESVILFESCSVNYNYPRIGRAAIQILEKNGVSSIRPAQVCCGMPALDGGDIEGAKRNARENVARFLPLIREGLPLVVLAPTCGYVIKQEWPMLLESEEASIVAARTFDIGEYLIGLHKQKRLDTAFAVPQGKLAYHIPCHLRAQNIGQPFRILLNGIPGTSVESIEQCSAFDGIWGMKREYYALSRKCAGKLCGRVAASGADRVVSDCTLAGLNLIEELGRAPVHPVEVLRDAYGLPPA